MKAIIHGKIVLPDRIEEGQALLFDEKIRGMVPEGEMDGSSLEQVIEAEGAYVSPGFVDVHIHGCMGQDTCDKDPEGIRTISRALLRFGVTSWLPTTMTLPETVLRPLFDMLRQTVKDSAAPEWSGAQVLGVNMEGPYLCPEKRGAHREDYLQKPKASLVKEYADVIRLVTIAPEIEGGLDFIREVTADTDVICSIGHTAADYQEAMAGIRAGCTHATHLFNAMTGLGHREPGVVGAVLSCPEVYAELICDTFHIHPALFSLVAALKKDKLVLITDCMRAGALPDGTYDLGGQTVTVRGIQCRLENGTIAGSVLSLNQGVANLKAHTNLSVPEVIRAASLNPAASVGRDSDKGSLEVGKDADIVLLDKEFQVLSTYRKGRNVYHGKL